jgi:hypothetical protein
MISYEEHTRILNAIKPLLRSKTMLIKIMVRKYDKIGEETRKVVENVLIEQFPNPPKETKAKLDPTMEPPKETKTEEEESIDQFFSTVHQPNFFIDNIPISIDTSQDVEDLFRDATEAAHKDIQNKEAQVERPVEKEPKKRDEIEKESKKTEEMRSHKDIEKENHDEKVATSIEHAPSKVKETLLASSLSTNVDGMDVEDLM